MSLFLNFTIMVFIFAVYVFGTSHFYLKHFYFTSVRLIDVFCVTKVRFLGLLEYSVFFSTIFTISLLSYGITILNGSLLKMFWMYLMTEIEMLKHVLLQLCTAVISDIFGHLHRVTGASGASFAGYYHVYRILLQFTAFFIGWQTGNIFSRSSRFHIGLSSAFVYIRTSCIDTSLRLKQNPHIFLAFSFVHTHISRCSNKFWAGCCLKTVIIWPTALVWAYAQNFFGLNFVDGSTFAIIVFMLHLPLHVLRDVYIY